MTDHIENRLKHNLNVVIIIEYECWVYNVFTSSYSNIEHYVNENIFGFKAIEFQRQVNNDLLAMNHHDWICMVLQLKGLTSSHDLHRPPGVFRQVILFETMKILNLFNVF